MAGSFVSDFNSGLPSHVKVMGTAFVDNREGADNSGVLKLTVAHGGQTGTFVLDPLDGNTRVSSFEANFKMLIGNGTGADGVVFCFHPTFPDEATGGSVTPGGLTVTFDTYRNTPAQVAPGIRVNAGKEEVAARSIPDLRKHKFVDVSITLNDEGNLNLSYDHEIVFTNLHVGTFKDARRFAFCARTGSRDDEHFIDDLSITTHPMANAFVQSYGPDGNNVSPSPRIVLNLRETKTRVKTSTIRLKLDGKEVRPVVETSNSKLQVSYEPDALLRPGSEHTVELAFEDDGPLGKLNVFSYSFEVSTQVQISR